MPVVQNPDGTYTRVKNDARRLAAQGSRRRVGAELVAGHSLADQGLKDEVEKGKHAYQMYGRGPNDPGFYGKNYAGASQNYRYDWKTGMKYNFTSPDNPNFRKWVPVEDWELKRHNNMQNYLGSAAGQGKTAADYVMQRWKRKGGYNTRIGDYLVNQGGEVRDARTGRQLDQNAEQLGLDLSQGVTRGRGNQGIVQGDMGATGAGSQIPWEQLFDQLMGNGQYRAAGTPSNQWRPSWLPQDAQIFF